jgi:serine/threonine-protein kinase HipA
MVTLRTAVGLSELGGQVTSYPFIADQVRTGPWDDVAATLEQIFRRLVFSILVGNKDDHLRNTAAFWDGTALTLTPAFDIAPQARMETESKQFPAVTRDGNRASQLRLCREVASEFGLSADEADAIIAGSVAAIKANWDNACDQALLTRAERDSLMGREFLNPYAFS